MHVQWLFLHTLISSIYIKPLASTMIEIIEPRNNSNLSLFNGGYKLYRKDIDNTPQMHLNDWIKKKLRNWPDEDRKDSHLTPQYMFVYNNNNDQVVEYVLKYEQLSFDLS